MNSGRAFTFISETAGNCGYFNTSWRGGGELGAGRWAPRATTRCRRSKTRSMPTFPCATPTETGTGSGRSVSEFGSCCLFICFCFVWGGDEGCQRGMKCFNLWSLQVLKKLRTHWVVWSSRRLVCHGENIFSFPHTRKILFCFPKSTQFTKKPHLHVYLAVWKCAGNDQNAVSTKHSKHGKRTDLELFVKSCTVQTFGKLHLCEVQHQEVSFQYLMPRMDNGHVEVEGIDFKGDFKLCFDEVHMSLGRSELSAIGDHMERSRKVILVLSYAYLRSPRHRKWVPHLAVNLVWFATNHISQFSIAQRPIHTGDELAFVLNWVNELGIRLLNSGCIPIRLRCE